MALFKVLKGQEANLPTEKKEGWAYVTYVENTIPTGQQYGEGSMYVDVSNTNRIKINMHADMASMDDQKQSITATYLKNIELKQDATTPYYNLIHGDGMTAELDIPVASASYAGIITADQTVTQTLTGPKVLDKNGSLEIIKSQGFNYTGIQSSSENKACTIWFSHKDYNGVPVRNTNFVYNPKSTDPWDGYNSEVTGTTATAHGVLTAERLQGIAYQAFLDTNKIKITSYLHGIQLVDNATQPYYELMDGDSLTTNVNLPVASTTNAGVITAEEQTLAGQKEFQDGIIVHSNFNFVDIPNITSSAENYDTVLWFSKPDVSGVPMYSTKLTYNQNCTTEWSEYSATDAYAVINVDRLNGLARYAVADSNKNNIASYYIHSIDENPTAYQGQQLHYSYTMGDSMVGGTFVIDSANLKNPGLLSATGTQYLAGQKIFVSESNVNANGADFSEIMLMDYGAYYTGQGDLPNGQISILSNSYAPLQLTSETQTGLIIKNSAAGNNSKPPIETDNSILVENLNVDLLDGYHASNALFEWSTADNVSEQVVPTRSAICRSLNNLLQASQALYYKGTIDPTTSSSIPSSAKVGDVYIFSKAGTCFNQNVEAGDMAICSSVSGSIITWNIVQMNIDGAVRSSSSSSNDNAIARFDGTTGKIIQNSAATIDDSGNITATKFNGTAALTGTPTAPTAAAGTNTTQIATTAFVTTAISTVTNNTSSYFSGTAAKVNIQDDTTSKLYVLGAVSTGDQSIYRESSVYMTGDVLYGAAWNDYAEFRQGDTLEPGKCVVEVGDDTLTLATGRLIPGASIISDTFGFSIGETEKSKTPIAVSGRVLAYPYESREEFKKNIGRPVCSGPNGTVSIMTDEEYKEKGYCAIGTISAVPDYKEWGSGNVKVNNRIWIHIK